MSTSVNQASRSTINWRAVGATYRSSKIPIERVVSEVWRASTSESHFDWGSQLGAPIIARFLALAMTSTSSTQALSQATREVVRTRASSLATDVAKRALVRSFSSDNRAQGFAESIFSEASNYLVSRDLPGYVGSQGRNKTIDDSIAFKAAIQRRVIQIVRDIGSPPSPDDEAGWQSYVIPFWREYCGKMEVMSTL